ncbi:hypothetical protein [Leptospira bandrabouensis]|uniref:Uncharacterized protein n=1 Tax=Leptospira bandrabouensis TaxID=2484903 RepID=A0A6H3NJH0_9LEPT|nr:hypothetical protein [Leptospira bandrabouensis]MCG6146190.1 hypothetical protein [Leptospira bandrabouensis]MCG6153690.1 hypothetical protein [Leptospira bandrabouensis]MCG6161395.1 hypothetical protein [Leptospira bandrabouensis]MCG6165777.1 hypothetical protein [Leptospira bandrabouensis]MCW7457971.1 hypothetical protein [Leptospira bandrabouensis]
MKKILLMAAVAALVANCYSIDKTKVGGKEVVTATQMNPAIFTMWGAPVTACLDDLNKEGVTQVVDAKGPATKGLFTTSRISTTEACQATGVK